MSCEWLKRPKVAMSEMADTLTTNMKMLSLTDKTTLLSIERVSAYQKKLAPLLKYLENLNSKSNENTTSERDVKGVLKFLVGTDVETDALIDEAMEVGSVILNGHPPHSCAYTVS